VEAGNGARGKAATARRPAGGPTPPPTQVRVKVPSGTFMDAFRIEGMVEDATLIRKALVKCANLHASGDRTLTASLQVASSHRRMEEHAQKIVTTMADYFLAQKVRKADRSEEEYKVLLVLHHAVMVAAEKIKQCAEFGAVDALDAAIHALKPVYGK